MSSEARRDADHWLLWYAGGENLTEDGRKNAVRTATFVIRALLASEPAKGAVDPEDSATWRTADGSMLVRDLVSQVMGLHPGADRLAVELAAYGAAKPRKSYATAEAPIAREHPKGEECTHYGADDGDCLTNACSGCCATYRETLATSEAEVARLTALLSAQPAPKPAPPDGAEVREAAEAFRAVNSILRDENCEETDCIVCKRRAAGDRLLAAFDAALRSDGR